MTENEQYAYNVRVAAGVACRTATTIMGEVAHVRVAGSPATLCNRVSMWKPDTSGAKLCKVCRAKFEKDSKGTT